MAYWDNGIIESKRLGVSSFGQPSLYYDFIIMSCPSRLLNVNVMEQSVPR